jgi:ribosome modulation factor
VEYSIAYQRGYDAYLGKAKDKVNPYGEGTKQANEWADGFFHAQADCAW